LELLYSPNESTTAQASFNLITTEFDSKPQEVKIIGSALKARIAIREVEELNESKTLLKKKQRP